MALQVFFKTLTGCTRSNCWLPCPLSLHLLTLRGYDPSSIIPLNPQQLQLNFNFKGFHSYSYTFPGGPGSCRPVPSELCRYYAVGSSSDAGSEPPSNESTSTDKKLIKEDSYEINVDSAELVESSDLSNQERPTSGNTNTYVSSTEANVEWSDLEHHGVVCDEPMRSNQVDSSLQHAWATEDHSKISVDEKFTERQQGGQNKERSAASATSNEQQDEHDLQALLRNIQRHQEEQKKKTMRKMRMSIMRVEELVAFLKEENARDVCVIEVAAEMDYVDYFIVCSGMSTRHLGRMADNLASEVWAIHTHTHTHTPAHTHTHTHTHTAFQCTESLVLN